MIVLLRYLFAGVLVTMLGVTGWASSRVALWDIPAEVGTHPWFIATLFDTYFAFLTFWAWVAYRERTWGSRLGWLVAILLLGNIAMAVYLLIRLFQLPRGASVQDLLLRPTPGDLPS